ncbi:hypothetical protein E2C01_084094 [Portunus trituberculatus]|uniref:Uncharacterized protein n=1 Tax=Portunus trituberculatus TaxID=210409 RepID=A0A5B7IX83_PORTR|nr:hypothetical protein [Portunus trituberculatus]
MDDVNTSTTSDDRHNYNHSYTVSDLMPTSTESQNENSNQEPRSWSSCYALIDCQAWRALPHPINLRTRHEAKH